MDWMDLRTFEILCSEQDGAQMMSLYQVAYLGSHFGAIPAHNQHLPYGPDSGGPPLVS